MILFWDMQWWGRLSLNYLIFNIGNTKLVDLIYREQTSLPWFVLVTVLEEGLPPSWRLFSGVENHQTFCFWWFWRKPSELLFLMLSPLTRAHAILITTCDPPTKSILEFLVLRQKISERKSCLSSRQQYPKNIQKIISECKSCLARQQYPKI